MQLEFWHPIMTIFAAFRLVDLFVGDSLLKRVRRRITWFPWACVRCVSVWAGAGAVAVLLIWPWLNWALAISWLYLAYGDYQISRRSVSIS